MVFVICISLSAIFSPSHELNVSVSLNEKYKIDLSLSIIVIFRCSRGLSKIRDNTSPCFMRVIAAYTVWEIPIKGKLVLHVVEDAYGLSSRCEDPG